MYINVHKKIKIGVVIPSWHSGPVYPKGHTQLKLPGESDPLTQLPSFSHRGVVRSVPFAMNGHASSTLHVTKIDSHSVKLENVTSHPHKVAYRLLAIAHLANTPFVRYWTIDICTCNGSKHVVGQQSTSKNTHY